MDYDAMTSEEFDKLQEMAYRAARTVLMLRRDPSIVQPSDPMKLNRHLLAPALCLAGIHFEEDDLIALFPIMRGVWEADREVGTDIRCWTGGDP